MDIFSSFSSNQKMYEFLDRQTDEYLINLRDKFDMAYYNSKKEIISDEKYDLFYYYLVKRIPSEKTRIGHKPHMNKEKLPYWIGSLDKKKDNKTIQKWSEKFLGPYIISEKLDGNSILISFPTIQIYTRGDGFYGSNISNIKKYLTLPDIKEKIYVRGEIILSKKNFEMFKNQYDNPRQMVSGLLHTKQPHEIIKYFDFIAYQMLNSSEKIADQLVELRNMGFNIPNYTHTNYISEEVLSEYLDKFRSQSNYIIDGIVINDDKKYILNTKDNPQNAFAFKRQGHIFQTEVLDIIWEISKNGLLKPTVHVKKVNVGDVDVSYITGNNAKFVVSNGIGRGSIIQIVWEIVPKIVNVVKKTTPNLPTIKYQWNKSQVDFIVDNLEDNYRDFCIKYMTNMANELGILNLGKSTITKLMDSGIDDFYKILTLTPNQMIPIMGEKITEKILGKIKELHHSISLSKFIGVSNSLGSSIGERKVEEILKSYPTFFSDEKLSPRDYRKILENIKGFSTISIEKIIPNIPFTKQLIKKYSFLIENKVSDTEKIYVVFSGFRDNILKKSLEERNYIVSDSISKKVKYLVVRDKKVTTKTEKAKNLGIEIIELDFFLKIINK